MLAADAVPLTTLITSRHPLEDAAACFEELLTPGTGELEVEPPARASVDCLRT